MQKFSIVSAASCGSKLLSEVTVGRATGEEQDESSSEYSARSRFLQMSI